MFKLNLTAAWVQISQGEAKVQARMQTASGNNLTANWIKAQSGCWRMIKGGLKVNATGPADLHFEVSLSPPASLSLNYINFHH